MRKVKEFTERDLKNGGVQRIADFSGEMRAELYYNRFSGFVVELIRNRTQQSENISYFKSLAKARKKFKSLIKN